MEIPPEEEQGRVQSQHRASRARRPVFQLSGHRRRHRCRGTRHLPDGYGARSASSQHLRICPALVLHPPRGRASPQPPSRRLRTVLMLPLNGNPNPGNVGSDFARFDMDFWSAVKALDARNQRRQDALQDLNEWRNAIAPPDWAKVGGSPTLRLRTVRVWRSTCRALARYFDRAVRAHLMTMVGRFPW